MSSLLKFQIGPVQDFIAQARSTRDLWSGSYLLSWLVAEGIRKLREHGGQLIFPDDSEKCQPLLELAASARAFDHQPLLTPNIPNIFVALVERESADIAGKVKAAIEVEWQLIATAVWDQRSKFGLPDGCEKRFKAQVDRHLSIAWMVTPLTDDYRDAYKHNGSHLDAVRRTREFVAWDAGSGLMEKDSLSGKEEALVGGTAKDEHGKTYRERMADLFEVWKSDEGRQEDAAYPSLFAKHTDYLGAIAIIKRCWHLAYLKGEHGLKTSSREFNIRSIPAIAARKDTHDDDESGGESGGGDKYIAAIAFDGDATGAWVNGDKSPTETDLEKHHNDFSKDLSAFALKKVREIVEEPLKDAQGREIRDNQGRPIPLGQLIYAGGDDVVALLPADAALEVCAKLRAAFCECTKNTLAKDDKPDASVGIAIGHIHAPLQDLIREAQRAEKRAKNTVGRPAFSVTLMKRSGEISQWGSRWADKGLELYQAIAKDLAEGKLSAKFPHRVCQLLEPYLNNPSPLMSARKTMQETADFDAHEVIKQEFRHAISRQSTKLLESKDMAHLQSCLDVYLRHLEAGQAALQAVIGLCTTVAFADRNREPHSTPEPPENQPPLA